MCTEVAPVQLLGNTSNYIEHSWDDKYCFYRENILFGRTEDNAKYNQVAVERSNSSVCDQLQ